MLQLVKGGKWVFGWCLVGLNFDEARRYSEIQAFVV